MVIDRRSLLKVPAAVLPLASLHATESAPILRAGPGGTFRILLISDLHFTPRADTHGQQLISRLIETEKPNLVVVNGDCISGKSSTTRAELEQSISHVAAPMEKAAVPWAMVNGNHDPEHFPKTGIDQPTTMGIYEHYPHNRNAGWARGIRGTGNHSLLIYNAAGTRPIFNVWLIDSGTKAADPKDHYEWIHPSQIEWYQRTSRELETRWGAPIPALMFFHIPLVEFRDMIAKAKLIGARHEPEACSEVNSGMFTAALARGDVRGIYCGHDHENNYIGRWKGIDLGYDGSAGYGTYPHIEPDDPANGHVRGGRVFEISESTPATYKTWMRFANGSRNWEADSEAYTRDHLK
jgi:UDP-2,3-diacylglucosamine pyrophosphatase LpxH